MTAAFRRSAALIALIAVASLAQSQTRPERKPGATPASLGTSQTSQLPAGTDTGEPGMGQTPSLSGPTPQDKTRRTLLRRQAVAADGPQAGIDDSAAAKAAARTSGAVAPESGAPAASSPGPSRKRSPPGR